MDPLRKDDSQLSQHVTEGELSLGDGSHVSLCDCRCQQHSGGSKVAAGYETWGTRGRASGYARLHFIPANNRSLASTPASVNIVKLGKAGT